MKKLVVACLCVLTLGVGVYFGHPAYRDWKQRRFLTQARQFLAREDFQNASLSAKQALALKPGDAEAARVMAQVTEGMHLPVAIAWRQRLVDLEPRVVQNRLDLARVAFLAGDFSKAGQALETIPQTNRNTVAFHQLAAMVSVAENNLAGADWHFTEAAKLDPQNKLLQLNQAIIHLQARNKDVVQSAVKTLESLSDDPVFRKDALRHLAMTAVRNKDFAQAEAFSRQLQTGDQSTFEDRILHLSVLNQSAGPEFSTFLESLQAECLKNPTDIPTLAAWLSSHNRLDEAIQWLNSLPETIQTQPPFRVALADAYTAHGDWARLEIFLQKQNWGDLDFIRLAHLAHAATEQKQDVVAQDQWLTAVHAAANRAKALTVLARLAATWHMENERENVLWMIAQRYPGERWALQTLNDYYFATGNIQGLEKVFETLVSYDPSDLGAKNNLASVYLLLNLQLSKAHEMARNAYEKAPKNSAFATTYAFSLHRQGRTAEGLKIMDDLPPQQLEFPSIAVYYGVLLSAAGDTAKAKKYFDIAKAEKNLLPEEKALIESVR